MRAAATLLRHHLHRALRKSIGEQQNARRNILDRDRPDRKLSRTGRLKQMQPFSTHTGKVAPIDRVNVDTDQMVPKQFLKALTREGFGRILFYDWRYLP